jgi:hypothetical protein
LAALANEILENILAREAREAAETPVIELADEAVEIPPAVELADEAVETPVMESAGEATVEIPPAIELAGPSAETPVIELEDADAEIPVVDLSDEASEIPTGNLSGDEDGEDNGSLARDGTDMVRVVDLAADEDRGVLTMTKDEALHLALRSSGTTVIEIPVGDGTFFTVTVSQAERAAVSPDTREASGSGELF